MNNSDLQATGIYCWRNTVNGKVYVGSASRSLLLRSRVHRASLRGGYHVNRYLQAAWSKYGEDAFVFEVLELCARGDCLTREQLWIDKLNAADRRYGYNLTPTAGSVLGTKQTPESNRRRSQSLKGRKRSSECRARMSASRRGMKFSPQHCANIGAAKRGRTRSVDEREKIAAALRGRKRPKEVGAKISASKKGVSLTPQHLTALKLGWEKRKAKFGSSGYRDVEAMTQKRLATMKVNGYSHKGENHPLSKLTAVDVCAIRTQIKSGARQSALASQFGVAQSVISRIKSGKRWGHLPDGPIQVALTTRN